MNRLSFYLRYALRSLRRDGTRTLLAGLSVAFGVLSLVAMQSLSLAFLHGNLLNVHLQVGGDVSIQAPSPDQRISASDLQQMATWQQQNLITAYTPLAVGSATFLRTPT